MIMEAINKEHYALIGNTFTILFKLKMNAYMEMLKHYLMKNLKLLKYPKLTLLGKQLTDIFLIEKEKIQDLFIR